jgi:hypothetical protein
VNALRELTNREQLAQRDVLEFSRDCLWLAEVLGRMKECDTFNEEAEALFNGYFSASTSFDSLLAAMDKDELSVAQQELAEHLVGLSLEAFKANVACKNQQKAELWRTRGTTLLRKLMSEIDRISSAACDIRAIPPATV